MVRRLVALLLLLTVSAAAKDKPFLESPGAIVTRSVPSLGRKRQWFLVIHIAGVADAEPQLIFDDGVETIHAPRTPLTLLRKPVDPAVFRCPAGTSPTLRAITDQGEGDKMRVGRRGSYYLYCDGDDAAVPVVWWGLSRDPGFDLGAGKVNYQKLLVFFGKPAL